MLDFSPFLTFYLCFLAIVAGLCMGSFLNCIAIRAVNGESISRGRSHCMYCHNELGFKDLIPVVSYISLRGHCRYCKKEMSPRYLISEVITGAVFFLLLLKYDVTLSLLKYTLLCCVLLCISFADIEAYVIPDRFILSGLLLRIAFIFFEGNIGENALTALIGGLSVSLPLLVVVLVAEKFFKREAMGGGDIKLFFMAGSFFTWDLNILALIIACVAGIVAGLIFKDEEKDKMIPFGPAISFGFFNVMLIGKELIHAYVMLFK